MSKSTLFSYGESSQTLRSCVEAEQPLTNLATLSHRLLSAKRKIDISSENHEQAHHHSRDYFTPKRVKTKLDIATPVSTQKTNPVDITKWAKAYRKALPTFLFYFDQIEEGVKHQLALQIRRLGGTIEPFFSSKITHLITYQTKSKECKYTASGKLSQKRSYSSPLSRVSNTATVTDLTHKANKWGIKVWTTQKLFNILRHLLKSPINNISSSRPLNDLLRDEKLFGVSTHNSLTVNSTHVHYFNHIYLLVEDTTRKYRPIAITEHIPNGENGEPMWPKIYRNTEGRCPFIKYDAETRPPEALRVPFKTLNSSIKENSQPNTPISRSPSHDLQKSVLIPKKPGYCENCRAKFGDLGEHIMSAIHSQYASDGDNYIELDAIIESVTRQKVPRSRQYPLSSPPPDSKSLYVSGYPSPSSYEVSVPEKLRFDCDEAHILLQPGPSENDGINLYTDNDADSMTRQWRHPTDTMNCSSIVHALHTEVPDELAIKISSPCKVYQSTSSSHCVNAVDHVGEDGHADIGYKQSSLLDHSLFPCADEWTNAQQYNIGSNLYSQPAHEAIFCFENHLLQNQYTQADSKICEVPTHDEIIAAIHDLQQFVKDQEINAAAVASRTSIDTYDTKFKSIESEYSAREDYVPTIDYVAPSLPDISVYDTPIGRARISKCKGMGIQELLLMDVDYFLSSTGGDSTLAELLFPNDNRQLFQTTTDDNGNQFM